MNQIKNISMESMNKQQKFSHEEGLKTIYAMIESAKGTIGKNYLYYLLWGYLVASTCILEFILIRVFQFRQHYLVWPVLMGLGLVVSSLFMWHQKRERTHKTFIGHIMGYLWGGWLISFIILLLFVNLMHAYQVIMPVCLVMYGLGIFVSGGVISFRPLILGGLIAWVAAVLAFYLSHEIQLLIMTITVILSYIIPGHLLRITSKSQKP
jgi:hypothetical protein